MYHCHIEFYCVGQQPSIFRTIQEIGPLPHFTHSFSVTTGLDASLAAHADVIILNAQDMDVSCTLRTIASLKKDTAQLILMAEPGQFPPAEFLPIIKDIWTLPISVDELTFHFKRWQQNYKTCRELWLANNYLDTTINSTPSMIWFQDKDGVHEKVNNSFCRRAKKSRDLLQGRVYDEIWDNEHLIKSERVVDSSREIFAMEETFHTQFGEMVFNTYQAPLYDLDGSVMGNVGIALDVTRERAYEADLLRKKNALESLFMTMECGIICHNLDGSIREINRAALRILGYTSQEELETNGFDSIAASILPEDEDTLRECIRSLHHEGESTNTEYRIQHKDGRIIHVMGNIKLVCENGELFYQRFLLDVTAQRLREQAEHSRMNYQIRYQERLFEIFSTYLSKNTDDVYMMLADDGKTVEYVSPNVERVLGISPNAPSEELWQLGRVQDNTEAQDYHIWKNICRLEPGDRLKVTDTRRVNPKTGEQKWFQESIYCVLLEEQKKIVIYISDRTKEKKAQDDLSAALAMAHAANKAKSNFLSSVSHDIRTPMNAIMGFVALLREEAYDSRHVLEYTQQIDAASHHLMGLINDVLDMNKIESGTATLNVTELNLADIIDELNVIIRPQAQAKEQDFTIHTSGFTTEHLLGDRLRIIQILVNILSNAVKYTQSGGAISMTVAEMLRMNENYSRVQFIIADNGQGMSKEFQEIIFNPFTREQSSLTNKVQGTGLGMSITKSLVDMMGGNIKVESEPGRGTTFTVDLELRIQKSEDYSEFWKSVNISRVIVVDADSETCDSVVYSIAGTGLEQVDSAADGTAAAEMIRNARSAGRPYDLILLDWEMTGEGSGLEAARIIRKSDSKTPVLVFSNFERKYIEKTAREVNIHYFLSKPFFMSNFKDIVQRLMSRKDQEHTTESLIKGKRMLVVDDIDVNRLILVKVLTSLGAICDTAENGQVAVDKFLSTEPAFDGIMMDIQMPVMDGYAATRAIRASSHPNAQDVAIMATTANAFVDDVRAAMDAGMDAHIAKPLVVPEMQAAIEAVFREKMKA